MADKTKTGVVTAKPGTTLSGIAKANKTTVAEILAANPVLKARSDAGKTVLFNNTTVKLPGSTTGATTADD
jgi:LysM repeat protein